MPPPFSSLLLPLNTPIQIPFSPSRSLPSSRPFSKLPLPASTFFPYSLPHQHPNPDPEPSIAPEFEDDDVVVGDCLVFDEGAFEDADAFLPADERRDSAERPRRGRRKPPLAAAAAEPENLVPEKWKDAVEELNLTKKEKRKIAHQLKFGSRIERRKPPTVPDMAEYRTYREMNLAQLKPVVLDDPKEFLAEKEVLGPPKAGGRVPPKNPRLGLDGGSLEDIADFFSSGDYKPSELDDDKDPRGRRKLFSNEEKVLLNKRMPDLEVATSSKWLPLHTLAASGEFYLLDRLLRHNVDINGVDKDGLSAIHKAIICNKQAIVNYLLRNSANPFVRDRSGWTPLHLAVQTQRTDIVRLLLIKGADRTLKNNDGLTPLELCLHSGRHMRTYELVRLLKGRPLST
ncbi:Ankyrin repeat domain-containing protein, chloroplastic [Ananas comosus]|uniref:Ankyrin repeat domain-containing protein, chloroplastic n=1 Tax=Ananas comosus TaxID=4615 RepID=A0A199W6N8_ANACO|nr:Ankyrin repeat domain-containing protein, chloroplastic [Ananas comosus]